MKIDLSLLSEKRRKVYEFYRLAFSDDGKPMKDMGNGKLVFHPILLPYLMNDFLDIFQKTNNKKAYETVLFIANYAISEAEEFKNSLVFWYYPENKLSSITHKFYSALTQSWYIKAFSRLSLYDTKYKDITLKFFNSLIIPVNEGGVLLKYDFGWIVEEYPSSPPLYTLNGWLTVIRWLIENESFLKSFQSFNEFIEYNLKAIKKLLPLYDAEFCYNSRYQLTGFTRFKMVFPSGIKYKINEFNVEIPGVGVYDGLLKNQKNVGRWKNYIERKEERLVQFNIVQSLISYPKENIINLDVDSSSDCVVKIYVADGDYDPNSTGMPTKRWRELPSCMVNKGRNKLKIPLLWDEKTYLLILQILRKKYIKKVEKNLMLIILSILLILHIYMHIRKMNFFITIARSG